MGIGKATTMFIVLGIYCALWVLTVATYKNDFAAETYEKIITIIFLLLHLIGFVVFLVWSWL